MAGQTFVIVGSRIDCFAEAIFKTVHLEWDETRKGSDVGD